VPSALVTLIDSLDKLGGNMSMTRKVYFRHNMLRF